MTWTSPRLALRAGLFFASFSLMACATYQGKVTDARKLIEKGEFKKAADKLEPLAKKQDGDQLVYLLDYGVAQQLDGDIKGSNTSFLKADKLAEMQDYHSVSRVAGSMLLSEEMVQYKGDTFEKIFINAYLAMNYLNLGELDDALVESRRMNEKYLLYRQDEKKKFELNVFGKYLSALVWEAGHQYDDAYIAYSEAYKIDPSIPALKGDLIRLAKLSRRMDDYKDWKKKFPDVKENPQWYDKSLGEVVVIFQEGWGPRKIPDPRSPRYPMLKPVHNQTQRAEITVEGVGHFEPKLVYDVESAAISTLKDDYALLVARRLAATATKAVVADQVRQKDELLGALTWIALNVSDRADLRQWSTLPQTIKIARIPLKPGKYKISIQGLMVDGTPTSDQMDAREVDVKAGKKKFVMWRSLH